MANIKNLQIWERICTDDRIGISKSLFGLRTTVVYKPTGSPVVAYVREYSSADGEQLGRILSATAEGRGKAIANFRPKPVINGNYMAEVCNSRDGNFLAVKLLQFSVLNYEAVTDVLTFEGNDAQTVGELLSA